MRFYDREQEIAFLRETRETAKYCPFYGGDRLQAHREEELIMRDYNTFSGPMPERYFHRVAMESRKFTRIGRWWDRKRGK